MNTQNQSNGGVFPFFKIRAVEDKPRSLEEGRPIFKEVEWVEIRIAGDTKTVVSKKVTDEHRQRWPEHYARFKAGIADPIIGTPLSQWPSLSTARVAELKALNIHTVEDLAGLSDSGIQNIGLGGRDLVAKAKAFMDAAKGNASVEKLAAENNRMKEELEMLKRQIAELGAEPKRKPGRPRKSDAAEQAA